MSSLLLRKPSKILREINSNALMVEWSSQHVAERIFTDRFEMYEYINSSVLHSEIIDYLEFGVFQGESLFKWADINNNSSSRFYGFDSFEGLPEIWDGVTVSKRERHFDVGGVIPQTNDHRIHFIKGLFQDTLQNFLSGYEPGGRVIVHNDSDLYSSTLYCLTMLDNILACGSLLIFDEFYSSSHEFQAFYDYATAYRRKYSVLAAVGKDPYKQVAIVLD
ncbi:MAG TPA: TylF/MycF/NovP-related O-methyltransferase [Gammaproteobacteria bacterium]|nr:TylF/MycF/NovP-related O-methyltransferase [Gammaproteobacteria bacterium]